MSFFRNTVNTSWFFQSSYYLTQNLMNQIYTALLELGNNLLHISRIRNTKIFGTYRLCANELDIHTIHTQNRYKIMVGSWITLRYSENDANIKAD